MAFLGPTRDQHLLFMLSVCRFQHVSVPLILIHHLTWTVVLTAFYSLLFTVAPSPVPLLFGSLAAVWAIVLDRPVGLVYSALTAGYLFMASSLAPVSPWVAV